MKTVYTTGDVARICSISQQTVIRCFDNGKLGGFRVPGSRFRRIPRPELIRFMQEHDIPLDRLESGKTRVLIIDDDEAIVEMLVDLFARDGRFEVRTGSTGFDAGMLVREFLPEVMLLDYKLPDINGNLVCRKIRSTPELRHTRIIMISGVADPDEIQELRRAGADDFIKKPFDIEHLFSRVAELAGL